MSATSPTTASAEPGRDDGRRERRRLVVVESPAKAQTISGYLGRGYVVESSIGHIRDLPRSAADVPEKYKKQPWARLGVDVEHGFEPLYVVSPDKKAQVKKLKDLLKNADELYLATDEDREGEAIAWHLLETLRPKVPVHRMVFHEITPQAIQAAVDNPRELDRRLVDAQETRRILDRLYGYEVSPVLWKKVMPKLSAGRVQSVATRLVVERERARMAFRAADYWDLEAIFDTGRAAADAAEPTTVTATLATVDGQRVAGGKDFDAETGQVKSGADVRVVDEPLARGLAERLTGRGFTVRSVEDKPYRRTPNAPFMTSTLQQEAGRRLRFSATRTMRTAQRLYENGFITYMRTDSTTLSETALHAARDAAGELYGAAYVADAPRQYARKVKNAQEAHEAIRPAGDTFRTPGQVRGEVSLDEFRVYELIWQRTVASQMVDATGQTVTIRIGGTSTADEDVEFSASGTVITNRGFLQAYDDVPDDTPDDTPDDEADPSGPARQSQQAGRSGRGSQQRRLPRVAEGDALTGDELTPQQHSTTPPARYTEATLVRALEERGIGRPSTYAAIISTIQDRGYVWKKSSALVPSWVAFAVVGLLERHFGRLVDYGFTASLEDDLDAIAGGEQESVPWLTGFYFGADAGDEGLRQLVSERLGEIDARGINSIPIGTTDDGREVVLRVGRYGPYVQAGGGDGERASVPEDLPPDELTRDKALELFAAPSGDRVLGVDPDSGQEVVAKTGRYGPYVSESLPEGAKGKPRTASLFAGMSPDTITLEEALRLLTLPRSVGAAPDGEEVTAHNGRYGPYVKKGRDSRSLQTEEQLFTVTVDEAMALFAQPKSRGRGRAAPPLRELGEDPASGNEMVLKDGRFGPYVTDGETNASLRKGDTIEAVTSERGAELLAERRAKGPSKGSGKGSGKGTAKKKTSRKAASTG